MGFQKQVNKSVAPGVAGDLATPDQAIYQAVNFVAEADCTVGNFVFAGTDASYQAKPGAASGQPIGLVQRNLSYPNYTISSGGSLTVPAGYTLTIAVKGDFWVKTSSSASVGDAVFASLTDGSISTAAPGSTVAGSVETAWRVKTAGAANDMVIISNWGVADASQISGVLGIANGGTGLDSVGTAGQVLKVNSDADGLEYGADNT